MWEALIAERGGALASGAEGAGPAAFLARCVEDEGLLPLLARLDAQRPTFLLKRGRVGGAQDAFGSLPITAADAAATLDVALSAEARWEADPDLGVELLVSRVPGVAEELLIPRFLYRRADRIYEYAAAMPATLREHGALLEAIR